MGASETVEVTGHLMDSGILSRILDDIRDYGGDYVIDTFDVGHEAHDPSSARITVEADDDASLQRLLMRLQTRGVNQLDPGEAVDRRRPSRRACCPTASTPRPTSRRACASTAPGTTWRTPRWTAASSSRSPPTAPSGCARCRCPTWRVGMRVVVGASGIQVSVPGPESVIGAFAPAETDATYEKPQAVLVRQVADGMRQARDEGKRLLWVAGPGVVHTGAVPALVALIRAGFVDTLFAGNALATHDIEFSLYGTTLGLDLSMTQGVEHGHEHHVRALNTIRKSGSIAQAVEDGVVTSGIMHALVTHDKRYVLVGSVRDDGPLPGRLHRRASRASARCAQRSPTSATA